MYACITKKYVYEFLLSAGSKAEDVCAALQLAMAQISQMVPVDKYNELKAQNESREDELQTLVTTLTAKVSQMVAAEKYDELKMQNETLALQVENLRVRCEETGVKLSQEASAHARAQQDLMSLEMQLRTIQQDVQTRTEEYAGLYSDAKKKIISQERMLAEKDSKIADFSRDLEVTRTEVEKELKKQASELNNIMKAKVRLEEYERKFVEQEKILAEKEVVLADIKRELERTRTEAAKELQRQEMEILAEKEAVLADFTRELERTRTESAKELQRQTIGMLEIASTEKRELQSEIENQKIMLHNSTIEQEKQRAHGRTLAARMIKVIAKYMNVSAYS